MQINFINNLENIDTICLTEITDKLVERYTEGLKINIRTFIFHHVKEEEVMNINVIVLLYYILKLMSV